MKDSLRHFFDIPLSRSELLRTGGEFTVRELREFGLGREKTDEVGNRGRELLYVDDVVPVRLVPRSLLDLAVEIRQESGRIENVIEALWTSFYVFRACVNKDLEVPLVKKTDGVWEWPEPATFRWGDETAKTLALMLGAYRRQNEASVSIIQGNTVHSLTLPSGVVSAEKVSDLVACPEEHLKYKVPTLADVRMINQQAWQTHALRTWAGRGRLATAFDEFITQELDTSWAEEYIMSMVDVLRNTPIKMPVVKYAGKNERVSAKNLFILEF